MRSRKTKGILPVVLRFVLAISLVFGVPGGAAAEPATVAVLYPEIREPYRSVFLNIVKGVEDSIKGTVKQYVLKEGDSLSELKNGLDSEHVQVVIALGTSALAAAQQLPDKLRIVVGAVLMPPTENVRGVTGITLAPDPEILFDRLKLLAPGVQRVTVVYSQQHNEWLIERAREAARTRALELNALPASDIRASAIIYREVLNKLEHASEAIWLPQDDATVDESAILPLILKEAWDRNLIVISSNAAHVKKGALMALYPDNVGLGRSLATLAINRTQIGGLKDFRHVAATRPISRGKRSYCRAPRPRSREAGQAGV